MKDPAMGALGDPTFASTQVVGFEKGGSAWWATRQPRRRVGIF